MTLVSHAPAADDAALRGTVRDETGGVIADASVEVSCGAETRQARSNGAGGFSVQGLPAGRCTVTASSPLFTSATVPVDLAASTTVTLRLLVRGFATSVLVTTARGRRDTTFDIPQMASVTTRSDIDRRPFQVLAQVLREEPGVLVQQTTTAQASPIIRGFTGQSNVYLINSVRFNTASWRSGPSQYMSWINSSVASRIEVVRGPGSVEYGSDALGGTINVRTEQPAFSPAGVHASGEVQAVAGSADSSAGGTGIVTVQAPFGAFRVGGSRTEVGDLRGGRGVDSHAAVTRFLGLPSSVRGERMRESGFTQSGGFLTAGLRAGAAATLSLTFLHEDQTGASRYDRIDGGDGLYRSGFTPQQLDFGVVRYQRHGLAALDDFSVSLSMNRQSDGRYEQTRPTAVVDRQSAVTTVFGYQVEGSRRIGTRHAMVAGTELYRESVDAWREQVDPLTRVARPNRPDIPDGTGYNSFGAFVTDTFDVVPGRLQLRGGIRYGRFDFSTVPDAALGVSRDAVVSDAVTFNAGAVAVVTPGLHATFNVGRGFRAPNAADLGSIGLTGGGGFEVAPSRAQALGGYVGTTVTNRAVSTGEVVPSLGPEVVYSFEPGVKFRAGRFSASAAAYDIEYLDAIERRAIVFPAGVVGTSIAGFEVVRQDATGVAYIAQDIRPIATRVNAGRARILGFDVDASAQLADRWTARTFFSMTNGRSLTTAEYLRRMPPPLGGASLRWSGTRVWVEGTTSFAAAQSRLNAADLTDARIGGTRTRASIAGYFNGTATDLGLVRSGVLVASGETLAQVQQRVLGSADSAPLYQRGAGFAVFGMRAGVTVSDQIDVTAIGENLTDRNYRLYGSGVDAPGFNLQLRARYRF